MCGLHEIERKMQLKQAFEKEKVELMMQDLQGMFNNIQDLRARIDEFENKYSELMSSPEYRDKLKALKEELGLAEVTPTRERTEPTVFEKLIGKGRFYNLLAVEILEVAGKRARESGGILTLGEVALIVSSEQAGRITELGDIVKAIEVLKDAGLITGVKTLPSGIKIVEFIPVELTDDSNILLALATEKGWLTPEEIMLRTKWSRERVERTLQSLQQLGVTRVDQNYATGTRWYFPGLMHTGPEKK
jgi:biotin operon repressor